MKLATPHNEIASYLMTTLLNNDRLKNANPILWTEAVGYEKKKEVAYRLRKSQYFLARKSCLALKAIL